MDAVSFMAGFYQQLDCPYLRELQFIRRWLAIYTVKSKNVFTNSHMFCFRRPRSPITRRNCFFDKSADVNLVLSLFFRFHHERYCFLFTEFHLYRDSTTYFLLSRESDSYLWCKAVARYTSLSTYSCQQGQFRPIKGLKKMIVLT